MFTRTCLLLSAFLAIGFADTLTLRNGRTVQGQYLGGDARQIRMAVGDRIESFQVDEIADLQFAAPKDYRSSTPPPPPAPSLDRRDDRRDDRSSDRNSDRSSDDPPRILRPDRDRDYNSQRSRPAFSATEIPAGTNLVVRMIDDVDSERDRMGQTFKASIDEPVVINGETVIPRGADVIAKLVDDQQSGKLAGKTVLTLDLMQVRVGGRMVDINTGEVTESSGSRGTRTAKVVGGTAALGAIIGAIAGGGKGAAIGAGSGAAVGGAAQVITKGQRVRIPSETRLTFNLQQSTPLQ